MRLGTFQSLLSWRFRHNLGSAGDGNAWAADRRDRVEIAATELPELRSGACLFLQRVGRLLFVPSYPRVCVTLYSERRVRDGVRFT